MSRRFSTTNFDDSLFQNKINCFLFRDILQPIDLAPPTKQLMRLRENCQLDKMLSMPSCMVWNFKIIQYF